MKKLVLLLVIVLGVIGAKAQTNFTNSGDTITNSGTVSATAEIKNAGGIGIQAVVTKISGTVAGTAVLQGSLDGSSYYTISTDTLTLSDVSSQTLIWTVSENYYINYKVLFTGSGTMSAKAEAFYRKR